MIAADANLDEQITAHTLRHTFATRLVRGRVDLITVAELLGHARLETTRAYSRPTHEDRAEALSHPRHRPVNTGRTAAGERP